MAIDNAVAIARAAYGAYVSKDRASYFARCWPNSQTAERFEFILLVQSGERVFVTYEARGAGGHRFRNTEIVTVRGAQIVEVEVYFGWNLPHKAAVGSFVEEA